MDLYDWQKGGISFAKGAKYRITDMKLPNMLKASTLAAVENKANNLEKGREQTYSPSCAEGNFANGITF